jgi:hypothetical protein
MSPLAVRIGAGALVLLALLTLRRQRWAYLVFVLLGLLYFPAQAHFHMHAPKCEQILPTLRQLVPLLHNYAYIALFAGFYWLSWVQLRYANARSFWALVATLLGAALLEISDGMTVVGTKAVIRGHCRVQDLVPAAAGALGAALLLAIWARLTRKPGYVRIVRPRTAATPRPASPPPSPRSGIPPRAVIYDPTAHAPPPPPPDFSPGPTPVTPSHAAPTEEVAPRSAARSEIVRRLQPILGFLRPKLQRIWASIRGRRGAIVVGGVVLAVVGAGALVIARLPAPGPVVTAQPQAPPPEEPPPPPPRPLQSEVEGYYEPNYKFTVSDRRFTRLTLRPKPSVTFTRPGTRQEVECADARISPAAVHLRCELESAGIVVTIDGQFATRFVTGQLDMPALSALITVTNTRGETVYHARDSFLWHVPD